MPRNYAAPSRRDRALTNVAMLEFSNRESSTVDESRRQLVFHFWPNPRIRRSFDLRRKCLSKNTNRTLNVLESIFVTPARSELHCLGTKVLGTKNYYLKNIKTFSILFYSELYYLYNRCDCIMRFIFRE